VVRVVTPGTIVEPGLLPGDSNNYLAAIVLADNQAPGADPAELAGLAYADITTGEFAATDLRTDALYAELARLRPAETIHADHQTLDYGLLGHGSPWPSWRFDVGKCSDVLMAHFGTTTLDGFGLKGRPLATRAAGVVLQYVEASQPDALKLLTRLKTYSLSEFMALDSSTRRNLELEETLRGERRGSLLALLDRTVTPMGKRLLQQWVRQPLLHRNQIIARQECVQLFVDQSMQRAEVRGQLKPLADMERLVNRLVAGHAQPRDLVSLRATLERIPRLMALFGTGLGLHSDSDGAGSGDPALSQGALKNAPLPLSDLQPFPSELHLLSSAIADDPPATLQGTGIIHSGYSDELDSVVSASQHARDWFSNLESTERARTGIKTLKVGYNKVFGYYIEISRAAAAKAPENYVRKQTLVNGERYMTSEMKEYEALVLNAAERIHDIELRLLREVCAELSRSAHTLLRTAHALAEIDVYTTLAEVAAVERYNPPTITEGTQLDIRGGRHPVVEQSILGGRYVPNDATFEQGEIIRILTGPNMAGKSTYLRQVALIVLMAQIGSFVPADSAGIGLVDRIFTRIGAQDEIHGGQSTFMVEMVEAANILHHATGRSLLILDEIGRGTSTYDGLSIAWAVVEYLHNHPQLRARTLFATHYHELTSLAGLLPGVRNYNVAVTEADGRVLFLHQIIPGGADKSYGIHVAQLAGMPASVVQRASQILEELEKSSGHGMDPSPHAAQQAALFPETSPLLDELANIDENSISPIEALNRLFEWKRKYEK